MYKIKFTKDTATSDDDDDNNNPEMSSGVECYWGEAKSEINVFVKEVMEEVTTIRKCLSGEETEERQRPQAELVAPRCDVVDQDKDDQEYGAHQPMQHHRVDHRTTIERSNRDFDFGPTRPTVASVKERLAQLRSEAHSSKGTTTTNTTDTTAASVATSYHAVAIASEETIDAWNDGDNEGEDDDDELEELSWRMNPLKSMSDWTIHVVVMPQTRNPTTDVYHVHKSVLAVGPRRSNYFKNLFREHNQMQQARSSTTATTTASTTTTTTTTTTTVPPSGPTWQLPDIPSATTILGLPASAAHPFTPRASGTSIPNTATSNLSSPGMATRLELPALAALAFPGLLDFLYDNHHSKSHGSISASTNGNTTASKEQGLFRLTTHNATALHVLAQRLDIKALRSVTRDFWMSDLGLENLAVYYQHATCLDDHLILRALEMYTAQHLFDTTTTTPTSKGGYGKHGGANSNSTSIADIFDLLDPQFVLNVITMAWSDHNTKTTTSGMDRHTLSLRLSLIVAVYCHQRHHAGELEYPMFEQLTDARLLPSLEAPAAKALLELQEALHSEHRRNERLTSLTERCVSVLADHWDDACVMSQEDQTGGRGPNRTVNLPRLAGPALESFVSLSLINAKERLDRLEAEKIEATSSHDHLQRHTKELQRQNEILQAQLRDMLLPTEGNGETGANGVLVCSSEKRTRTYIAENDASSRLDIDCSIVTPPRLEHSRSMRSGTHLALPPDASVVDAYPDKHGRVEHSWQHARDEGNHSFPHSRSTDRPSHSHPTSHDISTVRR